MELPEFTEFWSADERYGIRLPSAVFNALLDMCAEADGCETGGILVGRYNEQLNCAEVTTASRAPRDSRSGANWFARGVRGLQRWLNTLWHRGHYYLGEWHFHPGASPSPSGIDTLQMHEIAQSVSCRCPEPILIILGGNPRVGWASKAFVFPGATAPVELARQENMLKPDSKRRPSNPDPNIHDADIPKNSASSAESAGRFQHRTGVKP